MRTVTAPGKAVISGEYAVLIGAPAISVALDRRAVVTVDSVADDYHVITTPGFTKGAWRFKVREGGEIEWRDQPTEQGLPLVEAAITTSGWDDQESRSISIDTRAFVDPPTDRKYGLGSSAAAMTALIAALFCDDGAEDRIDRLALAAHAKMQDGLGSGIDVVTSQTGGVVEYRMSDASSRVRHSWPDDLHYTFLWSGRPASTKSRIMKFDRTDSEHPSVLTLVEAADAVANVWSQQRPAEIFSKLVAYTESLHQFSLALGLGVFDAGHAELYAAANATEVLYKPCGAGGGDIGIALSLAPGALSDFVAGAENSGFQALSVSVDPQGIAVSKAN